MLVWRATFLLTLAVSAGAQEIRMVPVATGVAAPTDIQNAGDGSGRLFFLQQNGIIRIWRAGALLQQPFLDIRNKVRSGGERGLLGLAFPPGFEAKQRFFVNYTDLNGNTVIAQYRVSANPDVADPGSETVLLHIQQPFANHNGGQLRFGPDGYMYIGMGDGGSAGDPQNNGQNPNALLGKMLRVDVESEPGHVQVPVDNPFVNTPGARPEVWALGLRNPWRYTFDRATGDLWIADVGQNAIEEVNFQPASSRGGENYGWNLMEGTRCFRANCSSQGLTLPVAEYSQNDGNCSVTGGSVYRGPGSPSLRGIYFYGDYCSGRIWGIERRGDAWVNRLLVDTDFGITTFGEDEQGEIYVADAGAGAIYRIEGSGVPRLTADAVVNAASFVRGLAPGSLATAFVAGIKNDPGVDLAPSVPLPVAISGVSVTVDGIAAPIHAVANVNGQEQVNFQTPYGVAGRGSVQVVVTRSGQSSSPVDVPVLDVQPAVFTSGGTQAIAIHANDFTLATGERPLQPGEFATVYATGLGSVAGPPATGAALTGVASVTGTVEVLVGGVVAELQYAGLAPGFVGVYQVNFRVPELQGPQDLVISAGGTSSPPVRLTIR